MDTLCVSTPTSVDHSTTAQIACGKQRIGESAPFTKRVTKYTFLVFISLVIFYVDCSSMRETNSLGSPS